MSSIQSSIFSVKVFFILGIILIKVNQIVFAINDSENSADEYVKVNRNDCFMSRKLFACFKYKSAKYLWSYVNDSSENYLKYTTNNQFYPNEKLSYRFIKLDEPSSTQIFSESSSKQIQDDNEIMKAMKFFKRTIQRFLQAYGFQLTLSSDSGARIYEENTPIAENRGNKKKKKWLIILPLIILMKLTHLKMTLVPIILGIGAIQLLLVAGGAYLFHYLKNNTLCRIQPHLIRTHSHVYDSEPEIPAYSGISGSPYSSANSGFSGGYSKDWGGNRAYRGYNNYLDTVSRYRDSI